MSNPDPHDEQQFRTRARPTDHFVVTGYRDLALEMISQHVRDVISPQSPEHAQAIAWMRYTPERGGLPGRGLTFEECVEYSGLRVRLDEFREHCINRPEMALRLVQSKKLSLRSERRSTLVPAAETRVGLGEIGLAKNNWLFGDAPLSTETALPAAQP